MKPKVVVIGAGVAGLSAALHLLRKGPCDVELLEKTDRVGGLASSFQLGPAIFDFGPHAFHSQQPDIIRFFQELMKGEYIEIEKNVAIKFNGRLYPYPLNPIKALRNMPLKTSIECGLSYLWNLLSNHKSFNDLKTSEEFFVRNFGWKLYHIFFEGYTHKVWGIHPKDLSVAFIKNRLPPASLLRILLTTITGHDIKINKPHEVPLKLRIFYPKKGSIQFAETMAAEIRAKGGKITTQCSLNKINLSGNKVASVTVDDNGGERTIECQAVVSTIPLPTLIRSFHPALPSDVLKSADQLKFRPILIGCLWIKKAKIFDYQTIYYTNRIFNRLAQMNSYSSATVPEGTCGITAEMTCQVGDELWNLPENKVLERIVADMEAENLITKEDVLQGMLLKNAHGYPVYHIGFEEHLNRLRRAAHAIPNLYIGGRQGMFNYAQMHFGVSSGMQIAEKLLSGRPKPVLLEKDTEDVFFT